MRSNSKTGTHKPASSTASAGEKDKATKRNIFPMLGADELEKKKGLKPLSNRKRKCQPQNLRNSDREERHSLPESVEHYAKGNYTPYDGHPKGTNSPILRGDKKTNIGRR